MADFAEILQTGQYLVDLLPWLRFLPEWLPGGGWKSRMREYSQRLEEILTEPFNKVKHAMVCTIRGAESKPTDSVCTSESRHRYPVLCYRSSGGRRRESDSGEGECHQDERWIDLHRYSDHCESFPARLMFLHRQAARTRYGKPLSDKSLL